MDGFVSQRGGRFDTVPTTRRLCQSNYRLIRKRVDLDSCCEFFRTSVIVSIFNRLIVARECRPGERGNAIEILPKFSFYLFCD